MRVRHSKLRDIIGRRAMFGGYTFVPAELELDGVVFQRSFHLSELSRDRIPPVLRVPLEWRYDVAWVRARLPDAFGISPEPTELEKAFLYVGFVAVRDGSDEGIAFELSDYYGRTSLTFSPSESDEAMKQEVANAFWGLLLADPNALADFEGRAFHVGAGVWMTFGCDGGEPYYHESED
jgi:hypothetical protein